MEDLLTVPLGPVAFVVLLGLLVYVHELGHFVMAKRAGVKVEEFAFGYPPRLVGIRRGETLYSLNLLPLGGFVRMLGEEDPTEPRSLARAPRLKRVAILVAGPAMNLLFAFFLFTAAFAAGWPEPTPLPVTVVQVEPGSPSAAAGLQARDVVVSFAGTEVKRAADLPPLTEASIGREVPVVIRRGETEMTLQVRPRTDWAPNAPPLGVRVTDVRIEPVYHGPVSAAVNGADQTVQAMLLPFRAVALVVRGLYPAEVLRPVGPVGIYNITSAVAEETVATGWWFPLLFWAASLSASLCVANLLPIPALDGGRLLFVAIEAVRGRRVSPEREGFVHLVGMAFLMSLILLTLWLDISNPIIPDFSLP